MLDELALGHVTDLWRMMGVLRDTLQKIPFAEGLRPLKCFTSLNELLSIGGDKLLCELVDDHRNIKAQINQTNQHLNSNGGCTSLNYHVQPVIGVIYGPTGSGKSQLLRNLLSSQLISPSPETIFFIAPTVDMIPHQEMLAWETQILEGNFKSGPEGTLVPQSGTTIPKFVKMSYDEFSNEQNYNISDPNNVFVQAAQKGPIAIIMDECMENLGSHKPVAKFFHAFPSKLHDRFPKCTGYTVLVALHNMNPRRDLAGNIATLKIQSKFHIISPKMHPSQLSRFINMYTKGMPAAMTLLLKDIFNYCNMNGQYDWIIYNTTPETEDMQWLYLNPSDGIMPMYMNVQRMLYYVMEKISRVIGNRERWTRYYRSKRK